MNVREAAAHIVYQPIIGTSDEDVPAAAQTLLTAGIRQSTILDLQDAAREVAQAGRQNTRHRANMAIDPEHYTQFGARIEHQMQTAQAKLTRAWNAIVSAEVESR